MKSISYLLLTTVFLSLMIQGCLSKSSPKSTKPNVLFVAVDDLRPQLNCYGESYMHTPNLDRMAVQGRLFNRHYVQVPSCGGSRYTLLLGQYPQQVKQVDNYVIIDQLENDRKKGLKTLPEVFRNNGYQTISFGKIGHHVDGRVFSYDGKGNGRLEMPNSWDKIWGPIDKWGTAWNAFFGYADGSNRNLKKKMGPPMEFVAQSDEDLPDGLIASRAIEELKALSNQDQPFFLAVGFFKPHLPFVAPQKYWDLYEEVALPISPNPNMPIDVAPMAVQQSGEMFNNYQDQPERGGRGIRLSDEYAKQLRRGYFAAVSYVDAQIGKLMNTLKETGLDRNTIVVVWGDHGWHLGDHTVWGKHTLFERSLRSTLLILSPQQPYPGEASDAIVETVDIYPTLLELCDIPIPGNLSGNSMVPVLQEPSARLDETALSFWRSGHSMRTTQYRLTKFKDGDQTYTELYDHELNPHESINLASHTEFQSILTQLEKQQLKVSPPTFWKSLQ